jgi:hypothetical protein
MVPLSYVSIVIAILFAKQLVTASRSAKVQAAPAQQDGSNDRVKGWHALLIPVIAAAMTVGMSWILQM